MANPEGCNQYKVCTGPGSSGRGVVRASGASLAKLMSVPHGTSRHFGPAQVVRRSGRFAVIHTRDPHSPDVVYSQRVELRPKGSWLHRLFGKGG